ncbi:hypothetical protein [Candidatus Chloroploca sp. Khr17]|uniref:hypothetical protein n=1 Tax=Candidatus Chloroploca sp. Khr17 TaxID=2496869 RepID=UPI00101C5B7A|nr:hypothetical protein [Candidatus Chloroploca sp. Khr17]
MTPVCSNTQPSHKHLPIASSGDSVNVSPMALRALLLLSEAVSPGDASLARLSDEELALLRMMLMRLGGSERRNIA